MKKKIISCLMLIMVVVLAYFYAHIDKNSYIYDRSSDTGTFYGTGILKEDEKISQTFIATENTLDGLNVKVTVSGKVENVVLKYELLDANGEILISENIAATELENNKFNKLRFSRIEQTKGKQYTIVLSEENASEQNGIGFYIDPIQEGNQKLSVKESETEGTLVARVFSHRFDIETFIVVLGMVAFVVGFMKILYKYFK